MLRKAIIWSPLAEEDLSAIAGYLSEKWNAAVVNKFLDKIESRLNLITKRPFVFPLIHENMGIRKCVIAKHNTLYYRVNDEAIEIVRLFDVRQQPEKLGFRKITMRLHSIFIFFIFLSVIPANVFAQQILGEIIVQLEKGISPNQLFEKSSTLKPATQLLSKSWNIWLLTVPQGEEEKVLKILQKFPQVKLAQFNHKILKRATIPNDTLFPNQWNLDNTGQAGGTPDADIDAPEAWEITTSGVTTAGDTIVIAVIDEGFDLQHEDLHFWKNKNDPPNGIDDDLNGYIDDYNGWDVASHSDSIPIDFHGTHIAGIAGAIGNNDVGIAGVAWNAQLMPVSVSAFTEAQVVEAYSYIYDMRKNYNQTGGAEGAFVVVANSSFGIDFGKPEDYPIWCAMYDSLGTVGVLSVASTMNLTTDVEISGDIPSTCTSNYLIMVTNTTRYDTKNTSAAFGYTSIDLGAPGSGILSTVPGNGYVNSNGTSMAAPHVAGAIAQLYGLPCSHYQNHLQMNPAAYSLMMKEYVLLGTDILIGLDGLTVSGGRLNLNNSMNIYFNDCISCMTLSATQSMASCSGTADGEITVNAAFGITPYRFEWSTGDTLNSLSGLARGKYWVKVSDANGCEKNEYFEITQPFPLVVNVITDSAVNGENGSAAVFVSGGTLPYSYQWNDSLNSTDAVINDLFPGEYFVTVTDANGCSPVKLVTVGNIVGIFSAAENTLNIKVHPNPVSGITWIEIFSKNGSPTQLSVQDISGKILLEKIIMGEKFPLDCSVFPQGTYFLKFRNNEMTGIRKIIRL